MCRWLLTSSIFWVVVVSFCFNVYTNVREWPLDDPLLLSVNSIFAMAMFVAIWSTILLFIYRCLCGKRRETLVVMNARYIDGIPHDTPPQRYNSASWSNAFNALADHMPQSEYSSGIHFDDCNCSTTCTHLVARCRVPIKSLPPPRDENKWFFTRQTLTHHYADCNCKCFDNSK